MDRFFVLKDLISFNKPIKELSTLLSQFNWDYYKQPFIVQALEIKGVLKRFIDGKYTAKEIEDWANLIELREDLEFEKQKYEAIDNIIFCLANPILQGEITTSLCKDLIDSLD